MQKLYEEVEEYTVEKLIYICKLNRNNAVEVWKDHFHSDFVENFDIYKHFTSEKIGDGYVENYIDEWR